MEVKPGYKQTEVGVIPEEWDTASLLGVAHCLDNVRVPINESQRMRMQGDIPYCGANGVLAFVGGYVIDDDIILMAEDGGYFDEYQSRPIAYRMKGKCWVNNHAHVLKAKPGFDQGFLFYSLVHKNIMPFLASGTRAKLNKSEMAKILVPAPPTEAEQRAIATALSDVDGLLGGLDRLIAKKRDLKQAAMQQLLTGQTRLPGFHGAWKTTLLKNLVTSDRFAIVDGPFGSQLKVDEYVETGVPIIEMEHLVDEPITQQIARCITPKKFEELKRSAVYPGDILISKTGSLGKLGIMPDSIEKGLITSRLAKITLEPFRADHNFVFQSLLKHRRDGYWEKVSQGGTMQILGIGMLQNTPIPDVSLPEQTAIAEVLTDMDAELAALEQRRAKTRALKQAMMQELLTGKTRLISPQKTAA